MTTYGPNAPDRPLLVLAHGAGAGQLHPWMVAVATGLAARGVTVVTFDFPYIRDKRRLPDRAPVLELAFREAWEEVSRNSAATRRFVGGKSMGGRIATQVAAKDLLLPSPEGIVCFGYPLHPPGKPEARRDAHLTGLQVPVLLLHGTRDPFGSPAEMRSLADTMPRSTLTLVEDGDHSLQIGRRSSRQSDALSGPLDEAARWLLASP